MERKQIKPYLVAVLLVALYAADIFVLSEFLGELFGVWGIVLHEMILALTAVGVFWIFRGKMKKIFPFHRPKAAAVAGTLVFWIGAYWFTIMITMIIAYFFPDKVMEAGQGVGDIVVNIPLFLSLFVVSVTPAICEEIAFRGALLGCFRGWKNRWAAILVVSVIFGAFHGSIWRMVPTMLLGIAMGYLLFETDNMIYNMLFHMVNNAVPVFMLAVLGKILKLAGSAGMGNVTDAMQTAQVPLASVASCLIYGGAAPFLLYIGNYLIHKGQPGYEGGLFPREKSKHLIVLISVALGMMILGSILMMADVGSMFRTIF